MTAAMGATIAQCYKDLRWNDARQRGFNRRVCGVEQPRTTQEGAKVVQALEAMILRLIRPYYTQLTILVNALYVERYRMNQWERDTFVPSVYRKAQQGQRLSPATIKKIREVAHTYRIDCGFPPVRDLAKAADAAHARQQKRTHEMRTHQEQQTWRQMLEVIERSLNAPSFNTWVRPIVPLEVTDEALRLQVPTEVHRAWLCEHYVDLLHSAYRRARGGKPTRQIEIVARP